MEQNLQKIREACIAANPGIKAFPTFPEDSDTKKALLALYKIVGTQSNENVEETATMYLKAYEDDKKAAYVRELEGRYPGRLIRLADILLAYRIRHFPGAAGKMSLLERPRVSDIVAQWNLLQDDLSLQSEETITFLVELLK